MSRFENREGQSVPEVTFRTRTATGWRDVSSAELFADQTVIVFSLPGAFTPTCSTSHVPRYEELFDTFQAHGVDRIVCMSVNDAFVMDAWKVDQGVERIDFIPDGNGAFTEGMGMLVNKADLGFGDRSWRYSMLVRNGVIEKMFIEPDEPGDPYDVSDADTMLRHVAPDAVAAPDILMLTKPFCGHCARAKNALAEAGLAYEEVVSTPRMLRAVSDTPTTPRVFVNGELIGGADELAAWLAQR